MLFMASNNELSSLPLKTQGGCVLASGSRSSFSSGLYCLTFMGQDAMIAIISER